MFCPSSFPYSSFAEFTGPVVSVLDGDTLEVLHNQRPEWIRISRIDCPEKGQAYGKRAKQAASALAFGREVTIQTHGRDKYKYPIRDMILPDGTIVNHALVKAGYVRDGVWERSHASDARPRQVQRTLADVSLPDGNNVNHTLVKDGWCWWYRKYALGDTVLEGLEKETREGRKGL
jgi:micrococcal nuclease